APPLGLARPRRFQRRSRSCDELFAGVEFLVVRLPDSSNSGLADRAAGVFTVVLRAGTDRVRATRENLKCFDEMVWVRVAVMRQQQAADAEYCLLQRGALCPPGLGDDAQHLPDLVRVSFRAVDSAPEDVLEGADAEQGVGIERKSTRLNSSQPYISY